MGALTAKNTSFKSRPWEMITIKTISTEDAYYDGICVDVRGREIIRILPYGTDDHWITNSTRYQGRVTRLKKSIGSLSSSCLFRVWVWDFTLLPPDYEGFDWRWKYKFEIPEKKVTIVEIGVRSSLFSLLDEVIQEKRVSLVMGSSVDGKLIAGIRALSYLNAAGITFFPFFSENRQSGITESWSSNTQIITMGVLIPWKMQRYCDPVASPPQAQPPMEGGSNGGWGSERTQYDILGASSAPTPADKDVNRWNYKFSGNNFRSLMKMLEGSLVCQKEPTILVSSSLVYLLPKFVRKLSGGPSNVSLVVNGNSYVTSRFVSSFVLNLNSNGKVSPACKKNIVFATRTSAFKDMIIPVASHWSDSRTYLDWKGVIKNSYIILYIGLPQICILFFCFFIVEI